MNKRTLFSAVVLAIVAFFFITGTLYAQNGHAGTKRFAAPSHKPIKVGNAELKRFATALKDVHGIQVGFQKNFQHAISKSPLTQKEFMKIYQSERSSHKYPSHLSSSKKQQYQTLIHHVLKIEKGARSKMIAAVKKDGLKVSRFDQIVRAVHSNPKLAKRLKKLRK